jgi:conjugative transposon TraM protein
MSITNQNDVKPRLSTEQRQKLKKYAVFALMGVICAGSMFLIFSPSADEKARQEQQAGFNADIPMPKNETIIGDKRDAYEKEQMQQKQAERMRSLSDFSSLFGENSPQQNTSDLALLTDEPTTSKSGYSSQPTPVQNSVNAYRDINRTLGSFYEQPATDFYDEEKEELKMEIEELKLRMQEADNRKNAIDEQMAVMERSFQMAQKYMPNAGTNTSFTENNGAGVATSNDATRSNTSGKTAVVPVSQYVKEPVSALNQQLSDEEFIAPFSRLRNLGFLTAAGENEAGRRNTILACIHASQTVLDGESVRLRLLEPMRAGSMIIRENTVLSGAAKIQGERLQITVVSLEYGGNIIPVEISVYDTDGQKGIFIPDTKAINAAKEIAANMGTNAGTSISLSSDAGEQFAADMGRSLIQGASQYFSRKMREVKVSLKAVYRVFLLPAPSNSPKGGELAIYQ